MSPLLIYEQYRKPSRVAYIMAESGTSCNCGSLTRSSPDRASPSCFRSQAVLAAILSVGWRSPYPVQLPSWRDRTPWIEAAPTSPDWPLGMPPQTPTWLPHAGVAHPPPRVGQLHSTTPTGGGGGDGDGGRGSGLDAMRSPTAGTVDLGEQCRHILTGGHHAVQHLRRLLYVRRHQPSDDRCVLRQPPPQCHRWSHHLSPRSRKSSARKTSDARSRCRSLSASGLAVSITS